MVSKLGVLGLLWSTSRSSRKQSYKSCALRCMTHLSVPGCLVQRVKQAKKAKTNVQLTAMQDSHEQLSIDHEQLQAAHTHMTDKCSEAALELSKVQQQLAESKLDLDTSRFLRQVCRHTRLV